MRRFRELLAVLPFVVTFPVGAQTSANSVTFTFPGCAQPVVSGSGPNYVVACPGLACQAVADPTSQTPGSAVRLAVACDATPTNVVWQPSAGCTTPSEGSIVSVVEPAGPKTCTYTATAVDGGTNKTGIASVSVQWSAGGATVTAPTGCAIDGQTAYTVLTGQGATIALSGRCSSTGSAPTKWIWRRNTQTPWKTTQAVQDSQAVPSGSNSVIVDYGLTACAGANGDVCAPEVQKRVTVQVETPTGGGANSFCGNYSNVIETSTPWNVSAYSAEAGGLRGNGVFVVAFRLPDTLPETGAIESISAFEFGGSPAIRWMTISESKCDFRAADKTGVNGPLVSVNNGSTVTARFYLPGTTFSPRLVKGKTYYINIRNWYEWEKRQTCSTSLTCDVKVEF